MTHIQPLHTVAKKIILMLFILGSYFASVAAAEAATLSVSPGTGVYTSNSTFTVRVVVNTSGKSINAAEGTLSFNPSELSVVSASRSGSIFNLWVAEPSFSNSAGTVSFSGGLPSGYTGSAGNIMTVTFKAKGSGASKVSFASGSVLANDGAGTNVLTSMNGGTFTIQAAAPTPEPEEVVVEYVAPANTPAAPVITSSTHSDQKKWYTAKEAVLNWELPSGVTAVRTLLDDRATAVPTKVYESPIRTITLSDLDEGVSYFHVQFKNEGGWGKVSHYRLAVDSEKPTDIKISQPEGFDANNPEQQLALEVTDATSDVVRFKVQIDGGQAFDVTRDTATGTIKLPSTGPGYHTVVVEAFDEAGNSIIGNYSFEVQSFEKPTFTEFPQEINEQVIPVIKGTTRPNATVEIVLTKVGAEPVTYQVKSDETGAFTFIPEGRFSTGVYEITARATDEYGAQSLDSDTIRIAVQQPGFIRVGSLLVSYLSVIIPLIALAGFAVAGTWYMVIYLRRFRKQITRESTEALDILHREFTSLQNELRRQEALVIESRKTKKLTKAEADMIEVFDKALQSSQRNVEKEITDVTKLANK
ncbi:MAG: hypothetical protein RLZZ480_82 [Candidatus Parcubacteria bacterium]|jgi:hypothetical protein